MTDSEKDFKTRFLKLFSRLTERFSPNISKQRVEDYYTEVKHHSISEIQLAVDEWIRDKNWMPTPAEFLDRVQVQFSTMSKERDFVTWEDVNNAPVETPLCRELRNLLFTWVKNFGTKKGFSGQELQNRCKALCEKYNYKEPELPERLKPNDILYKEFIHADELATAVKKKLQHRKSHDTEMIIKARDALAQYGWFIDRSKTIF